VPLARVEDLVTEVASLKESLHGMAEQLKLLLAVNMSNQAANISTQAVNRITSDSQQNLLGSPNRPGNPTMASGSPATAAEFHSHSSVQNQPEGFILVSVSPAQAIKLLAGQILEYNDLEEDDVDIWIEQVKMISQIHGVSSSVILLIASSRLMKAARRWYDLSTSSAKESWQNLKTGLSSCFKRTIPHHVLTQKVETRKWNPVKESFADYANDKFALMHRLLDQDVILYLVNGINN